MFRKILSLIFFVIFGVSGLHAEDDYFTEPQVYGMRPGTRNEWNLGSIGPTGLRARIYKGMKIKVEKTDPGTPAEGKFSKGDIILGVNGVMHKGKNPLPVFGKALTEAESTDGKLTFDIISAKDGQQKQVTLKIPVLGSYSKTYPLNCEKSKNIIKKAAVFYAGKDRLKEHNLWSGLACLFLLSTGDDKYVPRVKEYFAQFLNKDGTAKDVGEHTWFNGYNGIACAEYYLRTGDKSVLPLLQHYCDDARNRQKYGVGWGHWGYSANPAYESGGGMQHAAGTQMLTTLLLGKLCGVKVDDKTLLGALKHWYRFVGHGAIPVSDQRNYHIFRSAGRDGSTAAVMHIASLAKGDVTAYKKAKKYLAMSALTSWPERNWDWEVYWHNIAGQFVLDDRPDIYNKTMQRFRWRYDLGRRADGGFEWPERSASKDFSESGINLALAYTAPLRNLQITGAPRSKYAKEFTLPSRIWGNETDLAFLSSKHHKDFYKYGKEEDIHIPYWQLPCRLRYSPEDVKDLSLKMLQKNVRHSRYSVRSASAKALSFNKHFNEIEKLLKDPDPRLRRAGLDGINDCRPWFTGRAQGKHAIKPEEFTPSMIKSINTMMSNPNESVFVIDGALTALGHAPIKVIEKNIPNILPWAKHEDWWLRESAYMALMGLEKDEKLFKKHLPKIIDIMINEYVYNPRHKMLQGLKNALIYWKNETPIGKMIIAGLKDSTIKSEVKPDIGKYNRSGEGTTNIIEAALVAMQLAPESMADIAELLGKTGKLKNMDTGNIMTIVKTHDKQSHKPIGLYPSLKTVSPEEKKRLEDILYNMIRPELIKRFQAAEKPDSKLLDILVKLTALEKDVKGWQTVGSPKPEDRVWKYISFNPLKEEDKLHPRIGAPKRLREVTLPEGCDKWYMPEFDPAGAGWSSGKSPIGVGEYKAYGHARGHIEDPDFFYPNNSDWGKKEFILMRTEFELDDLDFDLFRLSVLADQGFHIYLNGKKIHTYIWFMGNPTYRKIMLGKNEIKHLKKGKNTLAAVGITRFEKQKDGSYRMVGQMDLSIEGLNKKELGLK